MAVTLASWLESMQALLPPGRALTRANDAVFTKLLEAIAAVLLAAQLRLESLLQEWDPRAATTMLPDWERLLGLPDDCAPTETLSLLERQRVAYQRLTELGGQSRAYFIGVAEALGVSGVTIDEFRQFTCNSNCNDLIYSAPDEFFWRMNLPIPLNGARPMNCNDDCREALQLFTPNLVECPVRERKPAHTEVLFSYLP